MPGKKAAEGKTKTLPTPIHFRIKSQEKREGIGQEEPDGLGAVRAPRTAEEKTWGGFHSACGAKTSIGAETVRTALISGTRRHKNQVQDWVSGFYPTLEQAPSIAQLTRYWL